ncbi:thiosulfate oxidation carrier protein SoxY [Chenggangzhangella methanolivorans]|uniref:Sulfur oxidation protein SoxY n=1 Tax=Chenggangzhangella methanolivorans TaxID=1437009 RepID=A0A9E6RAL2_9HYPH|nr:thiosulfate oxidation carrier protein SoxY [Chenggangzhangella methanolivorans]QZO00315.1 sulfur oxidation protein SoxY [Chenggangzhangella methanolivorans]
MTAVSRRSALGIGAGALALVTVKPAAAQFVRKDGAATLEAIRAFTGGKEAAPGKIVMDIPPLVENGNSAPLKLDVPGLGDGVFVRRIGVFNEKNPLPETVTLHLGPRTAPRVQTRIRLADSQTITAIAELSDGTFHSATADVIVTLAACVEG